MLRISRREMWISIPLFSRSSDPKRAMTSASFWYQSPVPTMMIVTRERTGGIGGKEALRSVGICLLSERAPKTPRSTQIASPRRTPIRSLRKSPWTLRLASTHCRRNLSHQVHLVSLDRYRRIGRGEMRGIRTGGRQSLHQSTVVTILSPNRPGRQSRRTCLRTQIPTMQAFFGLTYRSASQHGTVL